jgi:hypothetical protein
MPGAVVAWAAGERENGKIKTDEIDKKTHNS